MGIRLNKKNKSKSVTQGSNTGTTTVSTSSISETMSVDAYLWGNRFTGNNNLSGDMSILGNVTLRAIEDDEDSGIVTAPKACIDALQSTVIENTGKVSSDSLEANTGALNALQSHSISTNELTSTEATIHNLKVTGVAQFTELEVDKIKSVGGAMTLSPANGFDICELEYFESDNKYRLYFPMEQTNLWEVGDLAISYEMNNTDNTYFWTEVIWVGTTYYNDVEYNYIDITTNTTEGVVNPQVGQTVVHLGNKSDKDRQSAILMSSHDLPIESLKAPYYVQYTGINAPVSSLEAHRQSYFSAEGNCITGNLKVSTGQNIEDYLQSQLGSGNTYNLLDKTNQGVTNWSYYSDEEFLLGSTLDNKLIITGEEEAWMTLYYELTDYTLNILRDKEVYTLSFKTTGIDANNTKMYISVQDKNGNNPLTQQMEAIYDRNKDLWIATLTMDIQDIGILPTDTYGLRNSQHIYIYIPNPSLSFQVYNLMLQYGVQENPTWFISKNDFLGTDDLQAIEETITSLQVKQDSIEASVNDTSLRITNGDITLNGNTNINGNLVLESKFNEDTQEEDNDTGFTLRDSYLNEGVCRIAPVSIGTLSQFQEKSNCTLDKVLNHDVGITLVNNNVTQKTFSFTDTISLGIVDSGKTIVIKNSQLNNISDISSLHSVFSLLKTVQVKYELLDDLGNILATSSYVDELYPGDLISYESTGSYEYFLRVTMSGIIEAYINDDTLFNGVYNSIVQVQLKFKYVLPTNANIRICYDGLAVNFGNTNHVYIGKDKCVFKYGDYGFEIDERGLTINN